MKFALSLGLLAVSAPRLVADFMSSVYGDVLTAAVGASSAMTMALLGLWLACLWTASLLVESSLGRCLGLRAGDPA